MIACFHCKERQVHCNHKKGNTQDCGNYRQISLLNIQASYWKVLLVFNLILFWTNTIQSLPPIFFIDLQKAFDIVSRQILPEKLQASGLCSDLFDWIFEFLNNRLRLFGPSKTFQRLCLCPFTVLLVTPLTAFPNLNSKSLTSTAYLV